VSPKVKEHDTSCFALLGTTCFAIAITIASEREREREREGEKDFANYLYDDISRIAEPNNFGLL
jgi:hypothetical protein